jgi:hypothetical protein
LRDDAHRRALAEVEYRVAFGRDRELVDIAGRHLEQTNRRFLGLDGLAGLSPEEPVDAAGVPRDRIGVDRVAARRGREARLHFALQRLDGRELDRLDHIAGREVVGEAAAGRGDEQGAGRDAHRRVGAPVTQERCDALGEVLLTALDLSAAWRWRLEALVDPALGWTERAYPRRWLFGRGKGRSTHRVG